MKKILTSRWFFYTLGLIALSLLIWFVGPLIAVADFVPLESVLARAIGIMILVLLFFLMIIISLIRSKKTNDKVIEEIQEVQIDPEQEMADAESAVLRERMNDALTTLKQSKLHGRQKLYQLPWYILIGPPGSGKTTALLNSGLRFPLAEKFGNDAIHGIGGTRNCDWWFTDQAVMIDTAGRYTTQDSHSVADSKGWTSFMDLLRKNRPRRPINGAIIAISLTDLMTQTEAELNIQARAIRKRINELIEKLSMSFPVYILFTKVDLVSGFLEFYDDLNREEREQVWGVTFSLKDENSGEGVLGKFRDYFLELTQRTNARLIRRLHEERDPFRRSKIYDFPKQLQSLQPITDRFLREVFAPSKFENRPMLRGIYITSGTQVGTPIDRIMAGLARDFGMPQQALQPHTGTSRSFFLARLMNEVIFPEADLATTNRKYDRRRRWLLTGAYALFFSLLGLGTLGWVNSFRLNSNLIDNVQAQTEDYRNVTDKQLNENADIVTINDALTLLRNFPAGYEQGDSQYTYAMGLGLYQGDKLGTVAHSTYLRGIQRYFVPWIQKRIEDQIAANQDNQDFLYEGLKTYLMLYTPDRLDPEQIKVWMQLDWERTLPGQMNLPIREQLMNHLDAMLSNPMRVPAMNEELVARARRKLARIPLAQRAYRQIKQDFKELEGGFKLTDIFGFDADEVFVRKSGKPLDEGIPAIFTYKGYHTQFRIQNKLLAKRLGDETWIYGSDATGDMDQSRLDKLTSEVENLYFEEYIQAWRSLLNDLEIRRFSSVDKGVNTLSWVTAPSQPLKKLFDEVREQTQLTQTPELIDGKLPTGVIPRAADNKLSTTRNRLSRLAPRDASALQVTLPGEPVELAFRSLNEYSEGEGSSRSLANSLKLLNDLYTYVDQLGSADNFAEAAYEANRAQGAYGHITNKVTRDGTKAPKPIGSWLTQLAKDSSSLTRAGTRKQLNDLWMSDVVQEYQQAIENRYPLNPYSDADITLQDFSRFFGYGGTLESFFNEHIKSYVDTTHSPWSWKKSIGIPDSVLQQFEKAATIRKALFAPGSSNLRVEFSLKPVTMDSHVSQFHLDMDGQQLSYRHGPARVTNVSWPGADSAGMARISFMPTGGGRSVVFSKEGPWAWFRLLDQMRLKPTAQADQFDLEFVVPGHKAQFELRAMSVINPFRLNELEQFSCPTALR